MRGKAKLLKEKAAEPLNRELMPP